MVELIDLSDYTVCAGGVCRGKLCKKKVKVPPQVIWGLPLKKSNPAHSMPTTAKSTAYGNDCPGGKCEM